MADAAGFDADIDACIDRSSTETCHPPPVF